MVLAGEYVSLMAPGVEKNQRVNVRATYLFTYMSLQWRKSTFSGRGQSHEAF